MNELAHQQHDLHFERRFSRPGFTLRKRIFSLFNVKIFKCLNNDAEEGESGWADGGRKDNLKRKTRKSKFDVHF